MGVVALAAVWLARPAVPRGRGSVGSGVQAPRRPARGRAPLVRVRVTALALHLPQALAGLAATAADGRAYLFGGLGPAGFSAEVDAFIPGSAPRLLAVASLPAALHDGAAAAAGTGVWFCGGGTVSGQPTIDRLLPGVAAVQPAGQLPVPLSDLFGATVAGTPLCGGGWTGAAYSAAVYDPARPGTPVARLAVPVRYAAASPLGAGVLVAGGVGPSGTPSATLQWFPAPRGAGGSPVRARVVGSLPQPLAYAMGAPLQGAALVIGGTSPTGTSSAIWAVARPGVAPRLVGHLPVGLDDGAAVALDGVVYVFGGDVAGGPAGTTIWEIAAD
jgi:hypothetical protein